MCLNKTILIGRDKWVVGYKIFRSYEEGLLFDIYPEMHKGFLSPDVVYEDKRKTKIWSDANTGYSQKYMTGYHFYLNLADALFVHKRRGHPPLQLWQCFFTNITAVGYQEENLLSPPERYMAAVGRKMRIVHQIT